jgi:AraC-like DNA-binding protein
MSERRRGSPLPPRRAAPVAAKVWRAPELGAAEFLRGAFADYSYDPHTHDAACLALITEGAIRIKIRGDEFVARAGDIFAIDAGGMHAGWPIDAKGWKQRTLYVGLDQLATDLAADMGFPRSPTLAHALIRDAELSAMFLDMHLLAERRVPPLLREERYLAFVTRFCGRHVREATLPPPPRREHRAVRRAIDFLEHHLEESVRLADIARAAGLPPYRAFRAFARAVGMPPHAYQRQARVRRAAALIRHGDPLSEVAAAAGFADQAHMTRLFRRMMGVTPGVYRAAFV